MENIKLENNTIRLLPSKIERPKSYINLDVKEKATDKIMLEIYTEGENLIDGNLKIRCNLIENNVSDEYIKEAIEIFLNFCFCSIPINKVYYEAYQNENNLIKNLMKIGFKIEADLKEDFYVEGRYVDKVILAYYRSIGG